MPIISTTHGVDLPPPLGFRERRQTPVTQSPNAAEPACYLSEERHCCRRESCSWRASCRRLVAAWRR